MASPKIDDQYWFDYSAQVVSDAIKSRDAAAAKIQAMAVWLWGIYTAGAAIGFGLSGKDLSSLAKVLIALGSLSIIAVYWGSVWVQIPVVYNFDPRSPDIKATYAHSILVKQKRLRVTLGLSGLAASMVSLALIIASVAPTQTVAAGEFRAVMVTNMTPPSVSISGSFGNTKLLQVALTDSSKPESRLLPANFPIAIVPLKNGIVQSSIPVPSGLSLQNTRVSLFWTNATDGSVMQMSRLATQP